MQRYVAVLQQDPQNVDALYYVAVLALQEGQLDEGLKLIRRALAVSPAQARLHNLMGQAELRQNRDKDALLSFGRAIEAEPAFADAGAGPLRTRRAAAADRPAEALRDYDRAIGLFPGMAAAHANRGNALKALGRPDEALASFQRAAELDPKFAKLAGKD